ncbi:MAG: LON peptidase substrate-binding domain-containing protein, partial [Alphaproteobacteria bacterium]
MNEQTLKTEEAATSAEAPEPADNATTQVELPEGALILLPTRNAVLFPGIVAPLTFGRPQSIAAAQTAAQADKPVGVLL